MNALINATILAFLLSFNWNTQVSKKEIEPIKKTEYDWSQWIADECYSMIKYRYRCELHNNGKDSQYYLQWRNDYNTRVTFVRKIDNKPITKISHGGYGLEANKIDDGGMHWSENDRCSGKVFVGISRLRFYENRNTLNFVPCDDGSTNKYIPDFLLKRN